MNIIVKYYSKKMLLTIDTNEMFNQLIDNEDENLDITFKIMNKNDKKKSIKDYESTSIEIIEQRIMVYINGVRNKQKENDIINLGRK